MGIYTKSLFVTCCCMSYIFSSVTVAMFFYKVIFGILYFDFIHILAVFLVLGIGADDVFVVFDAWKQSDYLPDEFERFKYCWTRSTASIFNTSFTTVIGKETWYLDHSLIRFKAFAVTALTPLSKQHAPCHIHELLLTLQFPFQRLEYTQPYALQSTLCIVVQSFRGKCATKTNTVKLSFAAQF